MNKGARRGHGLRGRKYINRKDRSGEGNRETRQNNFRGCPGAGKAATLTVPGIGSSRAEIQAFTEELENMIDNLRSINERILEEKRKAR